MKATIRIYPEWNVKEFPYIWSEERANALEYIQNGM